MISHKYKFIFTKIGKTGSTSVESFLKKIDPTFENGGHWHLLDEVNEKTKNYFKFCLVRNPWDRMVSRYFYEKNKIEDRTKHYKNTTFKEFIINKNNYFKLDANWCRYSPNLKKLYDLKSPFEEQVEWVSDENGKIMVDYFGKFENLNEEIINICKILKLPISDEEIKNTFPHINKGEHRKSNYKLYYDDHTKKILSERFKKDIKTFQYCFE